MKLRYILPVFFLLSGVSVFTQEVYTLKDLLKIALQRAETINIIREEELISKYDRTKALSMLIPDFSLYGSHRQYTKEKKSITEVNFPGLLGEFLPPLEMDRIVQPKSSSNWGARLDQSYSLGGREFIGVSIARENLKRSKYEVDRVSEDYLMEVSNAYFTVLRTQRGVEIAKANKLDLKHTEIHQKKDISLGKI